MKKSLEPCGTRAAYMRHRRRNEDPCGPCKEAQATKGGFSSTRLAKHPSDPKTDAVYAVNPPVVTWAKNKNGILIPVSVVDPLADSGGGRNKDKQICKYGHEFTEENTIHKSDGTRQCRECKTLWNRSRKVA